MFLFFRLYRALLSGVVFLLPWPAFHLGYALWVLICRYLHSPVEFSQHNHASIIIFCIFLWGFVAEKNHITSVDELFRERTGGRKAASAVLVMGTLLLAIIFFSRDRLIPRGFYLSALLVLLVLVLVTRALFRFYIRKTREYGRPTRILFIGADAFAQLAADRLKRLTYAPCQVVGYVRLPGQSVAATSSPRFDFSDVARLNENHFFEEVLIAIQASEFPRIPQIVEALEKLSVPAHAIVDLGEGVVVRDRLFQLGRMQMLDLTRTPAESLDYALLKRGFDVCFSFLVLLLTAPLLALIAVLVKITSHGPVFFAQQRVGLNGHKFQMYKFRTMRVGSKSESDTLWTTKVDSRRTRLGTLLRKTSLDELPQFYNVLRGDMSVVGPRPERPNFVDKFLHDFARYNNRHCLKVGITGWAQVNGWRGDTSIEKRVEFDLYYLQNWSLIFDLRIIVMTILGGSVNKNAY
jgi:Undecaprenyl-phosphate glucose phosphotransferase